MTVDEAHSSAIDPNLRRTQPMDGVAFFLRNKLRENRFSDSVMAALSLPEIDSALLCSGFFQEDQSYSVSKSKFSALGKRQEPLLLKTVGYYAGGKKSYTDFVKGVAKHCSGRPVTLKAMRLRGDKWHAKVFIGKKNDAPIIAAIGSSNLTRRAFDTSKSFNYECDVLFWDRGITSLDSRISGILGQIPEESMSVVVATVDTRHPLNSTPISQKLMKLERQILEKADEVD